MDPKFERKIEDIIDQLKTAKENGRKCTLLIGAGCSVTAGIPTANEIVEEIENKHKRAYDRAKQKDYAHCMGELLPGERHDLIVKYIDDAKINWAHMCIGLLIQEGYVDRILTVNFDPLVARACALLGEFPAIYDFAASKHFNSDRIPEKAVFHLHGQHTGFVLLNTTREVEGHVDSFAPVFEDAGREERTWIVVGYSGECDPVFKHLGKVREFSRGLYWIGHEQKEPADHVREGLLIPEKGAFYTKGYHADSFFIKLTQELGIFPPKFVTKPFTHLQDTFEDLMPLILPDQPEDILSDTREKINKAIQKFEKGEKATQVAEALRLSMAGDNEGLVKFSKKHNLTTHPQLIESLAWAFNGLGIALYEQALSKTGKEADTLFVQAVEKYQEALKIKPGYDVALCNLGLALLAQAETKNGKEADTLFTQAEEKFQEALKIKPDYHVALGNLGLALSVQAKTKTNEEADELYAQAIEKYQEVLKIKPDYYQGLYNWGLTFQYQAMAKTGKEAKKLFEKAEEKYQEALSIKPNYDHALFNMACLAALTGDEKGCHKWLEKGLKLGPLTEKDINDSDLDNVRELDWFKKLVAKSKKRKE